MHLPAAANLGALTPLTLSVPNWPAVSLSCNLIASTVLENSPYSMVAAMLALMLTLIIEPAQVKKSFDLLH